MFSFRNGLASMLGALARNHRITIQVLVRSVGLNSPNGPPIGGLELSSGRCSGPGTGTGSQLRLRAPDHVEPGRRPPGTVVPKSILEDRLGLRQRGGFPAAAPGRSGTAPPRASAPA